MFWDNLESSNFVFACYRPVFFCSRLRQNHFFVLFEMERDRRVLYRVQLTRPPLTELNQCAFSSDSYLFYSAPDIWNALFRTFVLRTKSRSTFIFVSVASWAGETFIITELNSVLSRLIPLSAGHSSIKIRCLIVLFAEVTDGVLVRLTFWNVIPERAMTSD